MTNDDVRLVCSAAKNRWTVADTEVIPRAPFNVLRWVKSVQLDNALLIDPLASINSCFQVEMKKHLRPCYFYFTQCYTDANLLTALMRGTFSTSLLSIVNSSCELYLCFSF